MRPILLQGHTRALTQVKFSRQGDLIFSVAKDHDACVWYSSNGERLGVYKGHQGALWTVDVDPHTKLLATGGADNTIRLWEVRTGRLLKTWDFITAVKRVEFSEDGKFLLGVTEKRQGQLSNIIVYEINPDPEGEQTSEEYLRIVVEHKASKVTVAGFGPMSRDIIACHEDGSMTRWDVKSGELFGDTADQDDFVDGHEGQITDIQWASDRTYFITSSKDKSAKLWDSETFDLLKTYTTDTPLNSAAIAPIKDYVILGGGQAAMDVTTTSARQGKFEARFWHKIFEEEIGRVRGHFGPLNYVAISPTGRTYCSGGEDGYVRVHHFDQPYFDFKFEVERERERMTEEERRNATQQVAA